MGDHRDLTGSQLGPYHLDKRYDDLDEPGGQLYAAHHVETGRPALVLVPEPGDHWAPRSDWSARVTSQSSPPFLATELERPPPPDAAALSDVDLAFIRMAGGIASVEDRQDAQDDFTRSRARPWNGSHAARPPRWRHVSMGALGAVVLALLAVVLWPHLLGSPGRVTEGTDTSRSESVLFIDKQESTFPLLGYPMPETPFEEQMKPPCGGGVYVEIKGGCWFQGKQDAPCPKGTAEYEGKCYVAVHKKKPEPRSVQH